MTIFAFLMCLVLQNSQQEPILWYGKTFFYEIYCKKRENGYTVEVKGPKYYSIERINLTHNTRDTVAQNNYQAIIFKSSTCLQFCDVRLIQCDLKPKTITENMTNKRITLFQNYLYSQLQQKMIHFEMPSNDEIAVAFEEYDKRGDIQKIIDNYSQQ
jgi:hypothetical protein